MTELKKAAPREGSSTLYVACSATAAAIILGLTLFLIIRGFQWRAALADLRAEPGIEVLSVERVGFFKKRLRGLRDPLAPTAESYLRKHHLGGNAADVVLAEYHSLNTPYAKQRATDRAEEIRAIRDDLVETVGTFAEKLKTEREADLEKITQMLFEARFPEAMKTVDLRWNNGAWEVDGELYAPEREVFIAESPDYIIEGALDFSGLIDLTETRTKALRADIEATNLLETDLDGDLVHLERIRRLVRDLDEVCERSGLPLPALQLVLSNPDAPEAMRIREALSEGGLLDESRLITGVGEVSDSNGKAAAHLMLVQTDLP